MCADLQLQAEAVALIGWLACSSHENACAIGNFDSFISYIAILMGSTSARVQKQASDLAHSTPAKSHLFVGEITLQIIQACWAMCAMSVSSNRAKITSVQM
jgi:hypothetical protein